MIYFIVYFIGLILILLINNILDEFDIDIMDIIFNCESNLKLTIYDVIYWPVAIIYFLIMFIVVRGLKLIRGISKMKFTFNLREISQSIRKSFAPKEKVIKNKKKYSRKNKNWKKEI